MQTIAEVRQKFPQYADLSDDQLAQGLHKKYYSDVPFAEFSQKIGLSAPKDAAVAPEKKTDWLRQIGLGGRAAAEGVVNTLASPLDMKESLIAPLRNAALGLVGRELPDMTVSGMLNKGLNAAGAQNPETSGEHYASAGIRGVTSALTGGAGLGGMASLGGAVRAGTSGLTGSLASEAAKQHGIGQGGQMLAGLAGGFTPMAIEELTRLGTTTAKNVIRPMTRSGQQDMAANIMAKQADDPAAAAARLNTAQPIVPNSPRTTGEASQDIGLLALEKGVRARNPSAFGTRLSEQNVARQTELKALGGTPATLKAAKDVRDAVTAPMREAALDVPKGAAPVANVHQTIDAILASPVGKRETIAKSMEWAKGQIGDETNPAALYEIRKDLQLAQMGKLQPSNQNAPNASTLALARGQLGDVVASLDDAIETAAPGFKAYLARYKDMSKPVDQMKVIQEIQRRAELTSADVTTGQNFLGNASFSRALDAAIQKSGAKLTPDQTQRLEAIRTDLQYGQAINSPLIKTPGSDTFQNLSIAQVIGAGGTSAHPALRVLGKPLDWIYKIAKTDEGVNQILADAVLDPKLAAAMLRRATPASVQSFAGALKVRTLQGAVGTGLGSNLQAPSEGRNMSQASQ